jgi:transmembrane sensor
VSSGKEGSTSQNDLVDQAADWMARITDPDASASEFRDWQEWLNTSPAHAAAYQAIEQVWALTAHAQERRSAAPEFPAQPAVPTAAGVQAAAVVQTASATEGRARWRRRPAMAFASAAVLVAVAIGIATWILSERHATYVLETATAEQRSMQLPDGSHLVVGAETKVSVDLTPTRRLLTLDHGIAFFKVAPDKSRPFVVTSDGYTAQAVGTAFSVDAQSGRMLVTVSEGVVKVSRAANADSTASEYSPLLVHAGHRVVADASEIHCSMVPSAAGSTPSWISGRLEYLHEELRYVIADVNRYSQRKIVLNDPQIGHHLYTGTVLLEHVDEWVATLPGSFPVRVGTDPSDRFVLYAAGEQGFDRDDQALIDEQRRGLESGC